MANDFINLIERAIINQLRIDFPDVHIFGQFPEAVDSIYPAIVVQLVASGVDEKFMGENLTFGASNTPSTGEIYGMAIVLHLVVDRKSVMTVDAVGYKQRRLLNYLMLNVANSITDLVFPSTIEVIERHLQAWSDIGYLADLELWGASAQYLVSFENYREV